MADSNNNRFWTVVGVITCLKVLLIPSYRSTDFEVHRNWLAVTHSLPLSKWYYENTSQWTLDYPPFFAWFEHFLSYIAIFFDPKMLVVSNLNYSSFQTVLFQRLSVIGSDFMFIYATKEFISCCLKPHGKSVEQFSHQYLTAAVLLVANFGLLLIDHIHFQYNGFLFGILLLSIVRICEGKNLEGSLLFATLLNFKHIYLYVAPAYFIYLLRMYCFRSKSDGSVAWLSFSPLRFISLGLIVMAAFIMSFGPFITLGQLSQVLSRLFPFKRGLCHAYWAPNFWVFYNVADKVAVIVGSRLGVLPHDIALNASMTGGLVQEFQHGVLPSIQPPVTLVLTVISMMPAVIHFWLYPSGPRGFLRVLVLCAFGSFMFGWHVHEKAVLLIIIPLTLLAVEKKKDAQVFLMLSTVGHHSLFPLIFTQAETPIKYTLMCAYTVAAFYLFEKYYTEKQVSSTLSSLMHPMELLYLFGLVPLELYCSVIHHMLGFGDKLPFLPLLLTSVYCALGITYSWIKFYKVTLSERNIAKMVKKE